MEFLLLGPVEVRAGGRVVDCGGPRQRAVLTALAVDAGRTVAPETIIDRVWGSGPPSRVRHALHVYIGRLRRMLRSTTTASDVPADIVRVSGGYRLEANPDCVDMHRFRRLVKDARDSIGSKQQCGVWLRQALDLWRGDPLAGLSSEWAVHVREAWHRHRLDAVLRWAEVELEMANFTAVAGLLTELIGEYPLDESLAAMLMRALHATGCTADALDCYANTRQRLIDQLGVDPGTELQRTHQAILRRESNPTTRLAIATSRTNVKPVPAQLPMDVYGFVGRELELAQLDNVLAGSTAEPTAVVISAVSGTAGVGKTALAVHWSHRVADQFPDGQLYVNLRGFDPTGVMSAEEAIRGFLETFDVPPRGIPTSLNAQAALYRSLLSGKRLLVLLDNARDAEHVRLLIPGAPGCVAVVTSRNLMPGLIATTGAYPLTLGLISHADARLLLERRLGAGRVAAEPKAVHDIVTRCARLPLALVVVAARAASQPDAPLDALAEELSDARQGIAAFASQDTSIDLETVFSWSYATLSPETARLFRLLGLHPGPDIDTPAVASLFGASLKDVHIALQELAGAHMIEKRIGDRWGLHDLLRAYASELAVRADSDSGRRVSIHRMLDHYLHTAHNSTSVLDPHRGTITLSPAQPRVTPQATNDPGRAVAWLNTTRPVLLAMIRQASVEGFDEHTCQLMRTLGSFLDRHGHPNDLIMATSLALRVWQRLGDQSAQAYAHCQLARAHTQLRHDNDAEDHARLALELAIEVADRNGQVRAHTTYAFLLGRCGRERDALYHAEQALQLTQIENRHVGVAHSLNNVGWYHSQLGDHQSALMHCEQALVIFREIGDQRGEANTWDSLGVINHHLDRHGEAVLCYERSLDLFRGVGDRLNEADVLTHLGNTHQTAGDLNAAQLAWRAALTVLEDLNHPDAEQVRARLAASIS